MVTVVVAALTLAMVPTSPVHRTNSYPSSAWATRLTTVLANNIIISGATFESNGLDGYDVEGDIVLSGPNGNIAITDVAINSGGASTGIRLAGPGTLAPAGTITLTDVTISGTQAQWPRKDPSDGYNPYPSAAIVISRYSDVSNVSFDNVNLNSTAPVGLFLGTIYNATPIPTLDLTGISFNGTYGQLITLGRHGNNPSYAKANVNVDARNATFTGLTDNFAIEDKITHKLDDADLGLVTWVASNVYVTPLSGSIQRGIDAVTGSTVNVAAGTYDEQVVIDKSLTLQVAEGEEVTITSDSSTITVSAADVTISGFTITSTAGTGTGGIVAVNADNVTLEDNTILFDGNAGEVGDAYYGIVAINRSGLTLTGNTFLATTTVVNSQAAAVYVELIADSIWDGNIFPAASTGYQSVDSGFSVISTAATGATVALTISNNTFEGGIGLRTVEEESMGCGAIELYDIDGSIAITGNTLDSVNDAIWFGTEPTSNLATNVVVTITGNTITNNEWGVEHQAEGGGSIVLENNDIMGNTVGIELTGTAKAGLTANFNNIVGNADGIVNGSAVEVDATKNWWGDAAGPSIATNPYSANTSGDSVSANVLYIPWLIQGELNAGWNIWSSPIYPDEDTMEELFVAPLLEAGMEEAAAYWFDSTTQLWSPPWEGEPTLLDAWYFKLEEAATVRYIISNEAIFPAQKAMKVGWNLIGLAELYEMDVVSALGDVYVVTGDLVGYSKVISPSLNGVLWTHLRDGASPPNMLPTKGYWVFMVNDGVLGGFTSTPIVEVAP